MKYLLPLVALTLVAGASCVLDLGGLPDGGGATATTTTTITTTDVGPGGAAATTASSSASGTGGAEATTATTSTSSATASSSTGTTGSVWTRRRPLTLESGATSSLTDFPIAVFLYKGQIDFGQTLDDGRDIRFTDDQGALLDFEIERWDEGGTNPSVVWVRVPSVSEEIGANATKIWMYYGNTQASGGQNVTGVWMDGFVGVWHLSQDDNNLIDSSSKTGALAVNYGSKKAAGMIGDGRSFAASAHQYIDTLNKAQLNQFTVEAWGYGKHSSTTMKGPDGLLMREKNYQIMWDHMDPFVATVSFNPNDPMPNGQNWQVASFDKLDKAIWVYLAGTFDGSKLIAYRDGLNKNETSVSFDPQAESETAKIGRHAFGTQPENYFDGSIDEVRISDKARSDDWFIAQNKSMRNDGFISFGSEETGSYSLP